MHYIYKPLALLSFALLFSCQQTPTTKKKTTNTNSKSVSIPMHGTKQNSSSSSNQSFKEQQDKLKQAMQEKSDSTQGISKK